MKTLSLDIAQELAWLGAPDDIADDNGAKFVWVARQFLADHRWSTEYIIVFRQAGSDALYGFDYDEPATEKQDGMDRFRGGPIPVRFQGDPVPVYPVTSREVVTVVYDAA